MNFQLPFFGVRSAAQNKTGTDQKVSVGLDIGTTSLSFVSLVKKGDQLVLHSFGRSNFTPNTSLSAQIKQFFQKEGVQEKKVHISVKGQGIILRLISFPYMTRQEFASAIQYEAEKYIPFAANDVILDYFIPETVKPGDKKMDVVLVAARKQDVAKLIAIIQEADLQPASVDVDAIAFTNSFLYSHKDVQNQNFVLIDLGGKNTNINILEKGSLRFSRDITLGGSDVVAFLKRKLMIDDAEAFKLLANPDKNDAAQIDTLRQACSALIQEIKLSLNYFLNQNPHAGTISTIYASGGVSQLDIMRKSLELETKIPVQVWNALDAFLIDEKLDPDTIKSANPYLPVSIGLALRQFV